MCAPINQRRATRLVRRLKARLMDGRIRAARDIACSDSFVALCRSLRTGGYTFTCPYMAWELLRRDCEGGGA